MRCNLSGPLAAALLLSVASVPCPASWLDDTAHNAGVKAILAPRGTIDSGGTVIPRCIVTNYGDSVTSLSVYMALDGSGGPVYFDSLVLSSLAPAQRETVAFSNWVAEARDSMTAIAWTECEGDTFPLDDTARDRFLVRVVEGRIEFGFFLPETLDSGVPILPRARVWNYGNQSLWGYLRFRVDSTYYSRSHDINLIAGGATIVSAGDSWYPLPGWRVMACSLFVLPADTCIACRLDTCWVRGTIVTDVGVTRMWVNLPPDSIHVGDTVIVNATVANFGVAEASFWAYFLIRSPSGGVVCAESSQAILSPGDSTSVDYPSTVFSAPGSYTAVCSTAMVGDQNPTNDFMRLTLHVLPVGLEESPRPQAAGHKLQATVMRWLPAGAVVFDAMGRRVVNPKPGVYFVREEPQASSLKPQALRKVVIGR